MAPADPVLTASIYSNRGLDELIYGAIASFRARLREHDPAAAWSLWMVRYSRGGEHLKVRLHGPAQERELVQRLLEEAVEAHFAALPKPSKGVVRISRPDAPPIDPEDEALGDRPDRTLLWTGYRRSHVNLGPLPFLADDRYAELFTTALARGADLVLDALRPDAEGKIPGTLRQRALVLGLVNGIAALRFAAEDRAAYLAYHRDWLIRFNVADQEKEEELRARFDHRVEGMAPALEQVRRIAEAEWEAGSGLPAAGWREAVSALFAYLARFRGNPEYRVDPFTDDAAFPPLFKIFHALANHLGVGMFDEAFVHHLLLRATAADLAGRVAERAKV
jgi:hypothetical protein